MKTINEESKFSPYCAYLNVLAPFQFLIIQWILVHNPVSSFTFWCTTSIKYKCFFNPCSPRTIGNVSVLSGSFPVSISGCSARSSCIWILPVPWAKKEPLPVSRFQYGLTWKSFDQTNPVLTRATEWSVLFQSLVKLTKTQQFKIITKSI